MVYTIDYIGFLLISMYKKTIPTTTHYLKNI